MIQKYILMIVIIMLSGYDINKWKVWYQYSQKYLKLKQFENILQILNIIFKNVCRNYSTDIDYSKLKKRKSKFQRLQLRLQEKETKENFKKFTCCCDCLISQTLNRFSLILHQYIFSKIIHLPVFLCCTGLHSLA